MVESVGQPRFVRHELPSGVDPDNEILDFHLEEAAFDNSQVNDVESMDEDIRQRIEQKLAALKILEGPNREVGQQSLGSGSKTWRGNVIERLENEINRLDPSGELLEDRSREADFEVF